MSDYGSEGWEFESLRARKDRRRSGQVSTLTAPAPDGANCARGGAHSGQGSADECPNLTAIAARGELVYRQGFGWVSRPVAS